MDRHPYPTGIGRGGSFLNQGDHAVTDTNTTATETPARITPEALAGIGGRLQGNAPVLGAAVLGIRTITEILMASSLSRLAGDTGDLAEAMNENREGHLLGAAFALASMSYDSLDQILSVEGFCNGEDYLIFGTPLHLSGGYVRGEKP
jgi:hypothetical protein